MLFCDLIGIFPRDTKFTLGPILPSALRSSILSKTVLKAIGHTHFSAFYRILGYQRTWNICDHQCTALCTNINHFNIIKRYYSLIYKNTHILVEIIPIIPR